MVSVTGTLKIISGQPDPDGMMEFALCGYGSQIPRWNAQGFVNQPVSGQPKYPVPVAADGTYTIDVPGNDEISPVGTYYTATAKNSNGDVIQCNAYRFLAAGGQDYDLNLIDPFDPTLPLPPLPPLVTNQLDTVSSADPVFDGSIFTAFIITLHNAVVLPVFQNMVEGNLYTFILVQDATGGWDFDWPANAYNGTYINHDPNGRTIQTFVCVDDQSNLYPASNGTYWP